MNILSSENIVFNTFRKLRAPGYLLNIHQAASLRDIPSAGARHRASASNNPRKALLLAIAGDDQAIPGGGLTLKVHAANLLKGLIEVRNRYVIEVTSANPSSSIEVTIKQPRGEVDLGKHSGGVIRRSVGTTIRSLASSFRCQRKCSERLRDQPHNRGDSCESAWSLTA